MKFVVDADVARASGTSEHPTSKASRHLLDLLLAEGHYIAFSPELNNEWRKHRSKYTMTWLASMRARRRFFYLANVDTAALLDALDNCTALTGKQLAAAQKDAHLVGLALVSDEVLASLDHTAHGIFQLAAESVGMLRKVIWVDPLGRDHDWLEWIATGCKKTRPLWLRP